MRMMIRNSLWKRIIGRKLWNLPIVWEWMWLILTLGYYEFDDTTMNYRYRDLDGHYSLMSHSASLAADKGLVLVCSAGNSGRGTWKKITPPGDAENVITVGAADRNLVNADFSSVGILQMAV